MAYDKVVDSVQLDADLTSVANLIKEKAGLIDGIVWPQGFLDALGGISTSGGRYMYVGSRTYNTYLNSIGMNDVVFPDNFFLIVMGTCLSTRYVNHLVIIRKDGVYDGFSVNGDNVCVNYEQDGAFWVSKISGGFISFNGTSNNDHLFGGGNTYNFILGEL